MGLKICIISERLEHPFDEGIKNFAYNLIRKLSNNNNVLAITSQCRKTNERYIQRLGVNNSFLSYALFQKIRNFDPEIILYIPSTSATFFSMIRVKVLRLYTREAKVVMIALQPREYSFLTRKLISFVIPELILVQSLSVFKELYELGCRVKLIPSGVDLEKFHPVGSVKKTKLREKNRIDLNKFVLLHVGHINRNRNIHFLKKLQTNYHQVIIAGSTSTDQDKNLISELKATGVRVITDYIKNIEDIYRLSDCYIFPVTSETASIEIPLSVLEAMACNLPIITKRYGGLPELFNEGNGFFYYKNRTEIEEKINLLKSVTIKTRKMVEPYSWKNVTNRIMNEIFR